MTHAFRKVDVKRLMEEVLDPSPFVSLGFPASREMINPDDIKITPIPKER